MAIYIRSNAEPFTLATMASGKSPILANSGAGRILEHELRRYCNGEVRGRSFLVAGHRGTGKTTMVENAVLNFQRLAQAGDIRLKPLPIYLQGPTLFDEQNGLAPAPAPVPPAPASRPVGRPQSMVTVNMLGAAPAPAAAHAPAHAEEGDSPDDHIKNIVLIQVVQALHQAIAREYGERFHLHAERRWGQERSPEAFEICEMAARFKIELTEAPPAARLHEFWRRAGLLQLGLLFDTPARRGGQQGLAELVALVGASHVHQRISGKLHEKDELSSGISRVSESTRGVDARWAEAARPLAAVASGTAVAAAGAAAGHASASLGFGLLAMIASMLVFRFSSVTSVRRERKQDVTFVPDLKIRTLHRVMPDLIDRLLAAGLAPVFIVDELDKVDDLDAKIYPLIHDLKKLFAEWSFTCLLVDRGFYERLHLREELEKLA
jgi:hypothetical protein